MSRYMLAIAFMMLVSGLSFAAGKPRVLTPQETKYTNSLKLQCEEGHGQSCFDYAHILQQIRPDDDEKAVNRLIRRACLLAYEPACEGRKSSSVTDKKQSTCGTDAAAILAVAAKNSPDGSNGAEIGKVEANSLLEKAGVRSGDIISKINGSQFANPAQLAKALDSGQKVQLEIIRGNAAVSVNIACP